MQYGLVLKYDLSSTFVEKMVLTPGSGDNPEYPLEKAEKDHLVDYTIDIAQAVLESHGYLRLKSLTPAQANFGCNPGMKIRSSLVVTWDPKNDYKVTDVEGLMDEPISTLGKVTKALTDKSIDEARKVLVDMGYQQNPWFLWQGFPNKYRFVLYA